LKIYHVDYDERYVPLIVGSLPSPLLTSEVGVAGAQRSLALINRCAIKIAELARA
jgi:hypothetical protein